jgi:AraC family transcriptional regulator of adaptative response/methylated-DNA-[protein]-cysteine methyltransferase
MEMLNQSHPDPRWAAFAARDHATDGRFVAAVTSTGIFCRPGCPARTPRPSHVRFYDSAGEAMAAGFRPCRRCLPLAAAPDLGLASVAAICRLIEERVADPLPLAELAAKAGYSPAHFQRRFTALVGLSPRDYHAALRARAYRRALRAEGSATAALHAAGYGSSARVAGDVGPLGGMTPTQYRRGGEDAQIAHVTIPTRFGALLVAATERGVAFTAFGAPETTLPELAAEYPRARLVAGDPQAGALADWAAAIDAHLEGRRPDPRLPLDVQGTAFQRLVWDFLLAIPAGETRTYTQVAAGVGKPAAVRAAASACGANRVSVLIPCHRVIRGDGGLGGYRWGLGVKRALLAAEGAQTTLV